MDFVRFCLALFDSDQLFLFLVGNVAKFPPKNLQLVKYVNVKHNQRKLNKV